MTNEKREKHIRIANMLIELINDVQLPMLLYQIEKDVAKEALENYIKMLESQQTSWISVSERLPKENEYIGNVCKYYLIQDEYEDMYVAHLTNDGWIPMESLRAISSEITAWRELPESYKAESEVEE